MFHLKNLFGFLQNYERVIYFLPIELVLTRKIDNNKILFGSEELATAKVELKNYNYGYLKLRWIHN